MRTTVASTMSATIIPTPRNRMIDRPEMVNAPVTTTSSSAAAVTSARALGAEAHRLLRGRACLVRLDHA